MYYITITNHKEVPGTDIVHRDAHTLKMACCTGDVVILPGMSITMTSTGTLFIREGEIDGRRKN